MNTSLNATRRTQDLEAAQRETADLVVIGGGVTGAGVALDAASRGLRTVLLEAHDLAFGTSRWSSKLVHGGLRYLAKGDVALAHESAVERGILMTRTAPHLVRTLPMLFPLHTNAGHFVMTGLRAGNALRRAARTPAHVLPSPKRVSTHEAIALVPGLQPNGLRGGLLSYDGQLVDDARLVVALARTAAGYGARIITRAKVQAAQRDSVEFTDTLTNTTYTIKARAVINATGVWAGTIAPNVRLKPSRGSHLVVDAKHIGLSGTAVTIPVPGERNRYALLLPQQNGRAYLGLTDEPVDEIPDVPTVPESDVDFLLQTASTVLQRELTRSDVIGSYAGLRPLLEAEGSTADLSRHHAVLDHDGVITIVGGKLTTYRRMAADAVNATNLTTIPCRTRDIRLVADKPSGDTTQIAPGVTVADVRHAFDHEGALDADDVLDRRTRIGLVPTERAKAAPEVQRLVAT